MQWQRTCQEQGHSSLLGIVTSGSGLLLVSRDLVVVAEVGASKTVVSQICRSALSWQIGGHVWLTLCIVHPLSATAQH